MQRLDSSGRLSAGDCGERIRQITPAQWRWIKLILILLFILIVAILLYAYREEIFAAIRYTATWMRNAGFGGVVIMAGWSFLTAFPPVPLRETGMRLTGYVWGVPWGFLIAFCGSMLGSVVCFLLGRYFLHARVIKWIAGDKHLTAIKHSLALGGFKLIFLLRIGPFPFSWMSLLLSATDVHLKTYLWATVIGLQWVWYQVWIGTVLDNVEAASNLDFSATSTKVNLGVAFGSTIVSLIAMYYIKKVVEKILKEDEERGKQPKEPFPRLTSAADSNATTTTAATTPMNTELELPVGFARRFTPPSHALWASHMPKPEEEKLTEQTATTTTTTATTDNNDNSSSHKRESTQHKRESTQHNKHDHKKDGEQDITTAATEDEVVSLQDTTAGLFSGPLVDLEMVVKAVATARRDTKEPHKKEGEHSRKEHSSTSFSSSSSSSSSPEGNRKSVEDAIVTIKQEGEAS